MGNSMTRRGFLLHVIVSAAALAAPATRYPCAVCGMDVRPGSRAAFEARDGGKQVYFCGFACAARYKGGNASLNVYGHDFETGKKIDTAQAFFLVRSRRLLKEMEFGMPPAVAIFASRDHARKKQSRLGDGEIVKGFGEALKTYQ